MRTLTAAQSAVLNLVDRNIWIRFSMRDAVAPTTIAAGSSGATVSSALTTLNVASTSGYTKTGTGRCALNTGGTISFRWTGTTSTSFTGVTWGVGSSTTLATTGGVVVSTPDYTNLQSSGPANWVISGSWSENIDQYIMTAKVELIRQNYAQNLSPLMLGSIFNAAGSAIDMHREMWLELATIPMNQPKPLLSDWFMVFHGFSEVVNWEQDPIVITASDLGGELQKTQIEVVRNYGVWAAGQKQVVGIRVQDPYEQNSAPPTYLYWWECTTAGTSQGAPWTSAGSSGGVYTGSATFSAADYCCPTVTNGQSPQQFFQCTVGGAPGSTEPTWPAIGVFTTVIDGSCHWVQVDPTLNAYPDPLYGLGVAHAGSGGAGDGFTVAEYGSSTVVWTLRVPGARVASTSYALNKVIVFVQGSNNQYWICTTAGTSVSGTPPTFPVNPTFGQTIADNMNGGSSTLVWSAMPTPGGNLAEIVMQSMLNDNNLRISPTLVVNPPAGKPNTGWYFGPYQQTQEDVLSAVTALALQIGYDCRYWWNPAIGDFSLTLNYVNRANVTSVATLPPSFYYDITLVKRDIQYIRNVVALTYTDLSIPQGYNSTDNTFLNTPIRKQIKVSDATSIGKYGRSYCAISEGASMQTTDPISAALFAGVVLADLKDPLLEQTVDSPLYWPLQLNDLVTMAANANHYDSSQTTACISFDHTVGPSAASTQIGMRGVPTAGQSKYHDNGIATGSTWTPSVTPPPPASNIVASSSIVNGTHITFDVPLNPRFKYDYTEIHVGTTSSFIPSPSTLQGVSRSGSHHLQGLTPGTTYYARVVHRDFRHNQSTPSIPVSFVPAANKLVNVDLTIRQNLFAIVAADYTLGGATLQVVTSGAIGNQVGYDSAGLWNNTFYYWVPNQAGKYTVQGVVDLAGANPGDTAQVFFREGPSTIVAAGLPSVCFTDPLGTQTNRLTASVDTTFTVRPADVGFYYVFVLQWSSAATLTVKAPNLSGSGPYYPGTQLTIVQNLS